MGVSCGTDAEGDRCPPVSHPACPRGRGRVVPKENLQVGPSIVAMDPALDQLVHDARQWADGKGRPLDAAVLVVLLDLHLGRDGLGDAAWPAGSLRTERFAPKDAAALTASTGACNVYFTESDIEIEVGADTTIVEAAEQAGVPVIYSCMEGTCGTCETRVVCGEIDHRDSILSDEEKNANDVMMICVSRAKGDRLELEL